MGVRQLIFVGVAGLCCAAALSTYAQTGTVPAMKAATTSTDKTPAEFQLTLLDLAMDTASAIPLEPHIKDRCRAQQAVVEASLDISGYAPATKYTELVKDWRRGACYADLALYQAKRGKSSEARQYLEKADLISNAVGLESWRRDAIKVKMAEAQVWVGNDAQAEKIVSGLTPADAGKIVGVRANRDETTYEAQFQALTALASSKDLDGATGGLQGALELYDGSYAKADRRAALEKMIHDSWKPLPIFQRIEVQLKLCDSALAHEDRSHALELVTEAEKIKAGAKWPIEYETPLTARLVEYRCRAGDKAKGAASLAEALAKYDGNKQFMLDIEYVGALLPVAEAYVAISDRNGAMSVYKKATEESIVNPNSRPRALDLSAICRSLALHGFEPDAALMERLREIRKGLSDPW
jgi:hypothetical protein